MSNFIESLKTAKKNAIKAVFVEETISQTRFDICTSCEFLTEITNSCKKCGCFMIAKTKLKNTRCPIGKW